MKRALRRTASVFLAISYTATNCAFAHLPEKSFWEARRKAASDHPLLASALTPFSPTRSALSPAPGLYRRSLAGLQTKHANALLPIVDALSQAHGTIERISPATDAANAPVVVHISDIHQNEEAQKNIGQLVHGLTTAGHLDLMALEGAFSAIALPNPTVFPNIDTRNAVANYLLRENQISGPVHAAFVDGWAGPLVGIDDRARHAANVAAFMASQRIFKSLEDRRTADDTALRKRASTTFNARLAGFDANVRRYRENALPLGSYIRALAQDAPRVSEDITQFLDTLLLEERLNLTQVEDERARLLAALLKSLDTTRSKELLAASVAYRSGEISTADFYAYLKALCEQRGVSLSHFPAMRDYLRYTLLSDALDGGRVMAAARRMEGEAYAALCRTDEERNIVRAASEAFQAGKLLRFSFTRDEWNAFRKDADKLPSEFSAFRSFYAEAEARDRFMASNVVRAVQERKAQTTVLVTGGFHENGIDAQLAAAGFTVINVTPKMTVADNDGQPAYLSAFAQRKTPLQTLFDGERLFLARPPAPKQPALAFGSTSLMFEEAANGARPIDGDRQRAVQKTFPDGYALTTRDAVAGTSTGVMTMPDGKKVTLQLTLDRGQIRRMAAFAGEEATTIAIHLVGWLLSLLVTDPLTSTAIKIAFFVSGAVVFGFSHRTVSQRIGGNVRVIRRAGVADKMVFTAMGMIFHLGFLWPTEPLWFLAPSLHLFHNTVMTRVFNRLWVGSTAEEDDVPADDDLPPPDDLEPLRLAPALQVPDVDEHDEPRERQTVGLSDITDAIDDDTDVPFAVAREAVEILTDNDFSRPERLPAVRFLAGVIFKLRKVGPYSEAVDILRQGLTRTLNLANPFPREPETPKDEPIVEIDLQTGEEVVTEPEEESIPPSVSEEETVDGPEADDEEETVEAEDEGKEELREEEKAEEAGPTAASPEPPAKATPVPEHATGLATLVAFLAGTDSFREKMKSKQKPALVQRVLGTTAKKGELYLTFAPYVTRRWYPFGQSLGKGWKMICVSTDIRDEMFFFTLEARRGDDRQKRTFVVDGSTALTPGEGPKKGTRVRALRIKMAPRYVSDEPGMIVLANLLRPRMIDGVTEREAADLHATEIAEKIRLNRQPHPKNTRVGTTDKYGGLRLTLYPSFVWQWPIGARLPAHLQKAFEGDDLPALAGWTVWLEKIESNGGLLTFHFVLTKKGERYKRVLQMDGRSFVALKSSHHRPQPDRYILALQPHIGLDRLMPLLKDPAALKNAIERDASPQISGALFGVTTSNGDFPINFGPNLTYKWAPFGKRIAGDRWTIWGVNAKIHEGSLFIRLRATRRHVHIEQDFRVGQERMDLQGDGPRRSERFSFAKLQPVDVSQSSIAIHSFESAGQSILLDLILPPLGDGPAKPDSLADFARAFKTRFATGAPAPPLRGAVIGTTDNDGSVAIRGHDGFRWRWRLLKDLPFGFRRTFRRDRPPLQGWKVQITDVTVYGGVVALRVSFSKKRLHFHRHFQIAGDAWEEVAVKGALGAHRHVLKITNQAAFDHFGDLLLHPSYFGHYLDHGSKLTGPYGYADKSGYLRVLIGNELVRWAPFGDLRGNRSLIEGVVKEIRAGALYVSARTVLGKKKIERLFRVVRARPEGIAAEDKDRLHVRRVESGRLSAKNQGLDDILELIVPPYVEHQTSAQRLAAHKARFAKIIVGIQRPKSKGGLVGVTDRYGRLSVAVYPNFVWSWVALKTIPRAVFAEMTDDPSPRQGWEVTIGGIQVVDEVARFTATMTKGDRTFHHDYEVNGSDIATLESKPVGAEDPRQVLNVVPSLPKVSEAPPAKPEDSAATPGPEEDVRDVVITDEIIAASSERLQPILEEIRIFESMGIPRTAVAMARAGSYFEQDFASALDYLSQLPTAPGALGLWNKIGLANLPLIGFLETIVSNVALLPAAPFSYRILYRLHLTYGVAQKTGPPIIGDPLLAHRATLKALNSFLSLPFIAVGLIYGDVAAWSVFGVTFAALVHAAANDRRWNLSSWVREEGASFLINAAGWGASFLFSDPSSAWAVRLFFFSIGAVQFGFSHRAHPAGFTALGLLFHAAYLVTPVGFLASAWLHLFYNVVLTQVFPRLPLASADALHPRYWREGAKVERKKDKKKGTIWGMPRDDNGLVIIVRYLRGGVASEEFVTADLAEKTLRYLGKPNETYAAEQELENERGGLSARPRDRQVGMSDLIDAIDDDIIPAAIAANVEVLLVTRAIPEGCSAAALRFVAEHIFKLRKGGAFSNNLAQLSKDIGQALGDRAKPATNAPDLKDEEPEDVLLPDNEEPDESASLEVQDDQTDRVDRSGLQILTDFLARPEQFKTNIAANTVPVLDGASFGELRRSGALSLIPSPGFHRDWYPFGQAARGPGWVVTGGAGEIKKETYQFTLTAKRGKDVLHRSFVVDGETTEVRTTDLSDKTFSMLKMDMVRVPRFTPDDGMAFLMNLIYSAPGDDEDAETAAKRHADAFRKMVTTWTRPAVMPARLGTTDNQGRLRLAFGPSFDGRWRIIDRLPDAFTGLFTENPLAGWQVSFKSVTAHDNLMELVFELTKADEAFSRTFQVDGHTLTWVRDLSHTKKPARPILTLAPRLAIDRLLPLLSNPAMFAQAIRERNVPDLKGALFGTAPRTGSLSITVAPNFPHPWRPFKRQIANDRWTLRGSGSEVRGDAFYFRVRATRGRHVIEQEFRLSDKTTPVQGEGPRKGQTIAMLLIEPVGMLDADAHQPSAESSTGAEIFLDLLRPPLDDRPARVAADAFGRAFKERMKPQHAQPLAVGAYLGHTNSVGELVFHPYENFPWRWRLLPRLPSAMAQAPRGREKALAGWSVRVVSVSVHNSLLELRLAFVRGGVSFTRRFQIISDELETLPGIRDQIRKERFLLKVIDQTGLDEISDLVYAPETFVQRMASGDMPALNKASFGYTNRAGFLTVGSGSASFLWAPNGIRLKKGRWHVSGADSAVRDGAYYFSTDTMDGPTVIRRAFKIDGTVQDGRLEIMPIETGRSRPKTSGLDLLLDLMVPPYVEWTTSDDRLEKHLVDFQKRLAAGSLPNITPAPIGITDNAGRLTFAAYPNYTWRWPVTGLIPETALVPTDKDPHPRKGWAATLEEIKSRDGLIEFEMRLTKKDHSFEQVYQVTGDEREDLSSDASATAPARTILIPSAKPGLILLADLLTWGAEFKKRIAPPNEPRLTGKLFGTTHTEGFLVVGRKGERPIRWYAFGRRTDKQRFLVRCLEGAVRSMELYLKLGATISGAEIVREFIIDGSLSEHGGQRLLAIKSLKKKRRAVDGAHTRSVTPAFNLLANVLFPTPELGEKSSVVARKHSARLRREWSAEVVPALTGRVIGTTTEEGALSFYPYPGYEWTWPVTGRLPARLKGKFTRSDWQAGWEVMVEDVKARRSTLILTIRLSKDKETYTRVFQIIPGRLRKIEPAVDKLLPPHYVQALSPSAGLEELAEFLYTPQRFWTRMENGQVPDLQEKLFSGSADPRMSVPYRSDFRWPFEPFRLDPQQGPWLIWGKESAKRGDAFYFSLVATNGREHHVASFKVDGTTFDLKAGNGPNTLPVLKISRIDTSEIPTRERSRPRTQQPAPEELPEPTTLPSPVPPALLNLEPAMTIVITDDMVATAPPRISKILEEMRVLLGFGIEANATALSLAGSFYQADFAEALAYVANPPAPGALGLWNKIGLTSLPLIGFLETIAINIVLLPVAPFAYRILYRLHLTYGVAQPTGPPTIGDPRLAHRATLTSLLSFLSLPFIVFGLLYGDVIAWTAFGVSFASLAHAAANDRRWRLSSWGWEEGAAFLINAVGWGASFLFSDPLSAWAVRLLFFFVSAVHFGFSHRVDRAGFTALGLFFHAAYLVTPAGVLASAWLHLFYNVVLTRVFPELPLASTDIPPSLWQSGAKVKSRRSGKVGKIFGTPGAKGGRRIIVRFGDKEYILSERNAAKKLIYLGEPTPVAAPTNAPSAAAATLSDDDLIVGLSDLMEAIDDEEVPPSLVRQVENILTNSSIPPGMSDEALRLVAGCIARLASRGAFSPGLTSLRRAIGVALGESPRTFHADASPETSVPAPELEPMPDEHDPDYLRIVADMESLLGAEEAPAAAKTPPTTAAPATAAPAARPAPEPARRPAVVPVSAPRAEDVARPMDRKRRLATEKGGVDRSGLLILADFLSNPALFKKSIKKGILPGLRDKGFGPLNKNGTLMVTYAPGFNRPWKPFSENVLGEGWRVECVAIEKEEDFLRFTLRAHRGLQHVDRSFVVDGKTSSVPGRGAYKGRTMSVLQVTKAPRPRVAAERAGMVFILGLLSPPVVPGKTPSQEAKAYSESFKARLRARNFPNVSEQFLGITDKKGNLRTAPYPSFEWDWAVTGPLPKHLRPIFAPDEYPLAGWDVRIKSTTVYHDVLDLVLSFSKRGEKFTRVFQISGDEFIALKSTTRRAQPDRYLLEPSDRLGLDAIAALIKDPAVLKKAIQEEKAPKILGRRFGRTSESGSVSVHVGKRASYKWDPFGRQIANDRWVLTGGEAVVKDGVILFQVLATRGRSSLQRVFRLDDEFLAVMAQGHLKGQETLIARISPADHEVLGGAVLTGAVDDAQTGLIELITPPETEARSPKEEAEAFAANFRTRHGPQAARPKVKGSVLGMTDAEGCLSFMPYPNVPWSWKVVDALPHRIKSAFEGDPFPLRGWQVQIAQVNVVNGVVGLRLSYLKNGRTFVRTFQIAGEELEELTPAGPATGSPRYLLKITSQAALSDLVELIFSPGDFAGRLTAGTFPKVAGATLGYTNARSVLRAYVNGKTFLWTPLGWMPAARRWLIRAESGDLRDGAYYVGLVATSASNLVRGLFKIDGSLNAGEEQGLPARLAATRVDTAASPLKVTKSPPTDSVPDTVPMSRLPAARLVPPAPVLPEPTIDLAGGPLVLTDEIIAASPPGLLEILKEIKVLLSFGIAADPEALGMAGSFFAPSYARALDWVRQRQAPGALGLWNNFGLKNLSLIGFLETFAINVVLLPVAPLAYRVLYRLHFRYGVAQPTGPPIEGDAALAHRATLKALLSFLSLPFVLVGLFCGDIAVWTAFGITLAALTHAAANDARWKLFSFAREETAVLLINSAGWLLSAFFSDPLHALLVRGTFFVMGAVHFGVSHRAHKAGRTGLGLIFHAAYLVTPAGVLASAWLHLFHNVVLTRLFPGLWLASTSDPDFNVIGLADLMEAIDDEEVPPSLSADVESILTTSSIHSLVSKAALRLVGGRIFRMKNRGSFSPGLRALQKAIGVALGDTMLVEDKLPATPPPDAPAPDDSVPDELPATTSTEEPPAQSGVRRRRNATDKNDSDRSGLILLTEFLAHPESFKKSVKGGSVPVLTGKGFGHLSKDRALFLTFAAGFSRLWNPFARHVQGEGWDVRCIGSETKDREFLFTLRATRGSERSDRTFVVDGTLSNVSGRGKNQGRTMATLAVAMAPPTRSVSENPGLAFIVGLLTPPKIPGKNPSEEAVAHAEHFKARLLEGDLPDVSGMLVGVTKKEPGLLTYPYPSYGWDWAALGRLPNHLARAFKNDPLPHVGWEIRIKSTAIHDGLLDIVLAYSKQGEKFVRVFQVSGDEFLPLKSRTQTPQPERYILEISDRLGLDAVLALVKNPALLKERISDEDPLRIKGRRFGNAESGRLHLFLARLFSYQWKPFDRQIADDRWTIIGGESVVKNGALLFQLFASRGRYALQRVFQLDEKTVTVKGRGALRDQKMAIAKISPVDDEALEVPALGGLSEDAQSGLMDLITPPFVDDDSSKQNAEAFARMFRERFGPRATKPNFRGSILGVTNREGALVFEPYPNYPWSWTVVDRLPHHVREEFLTDPAPMQDWQVHVSQVNVYNGVVELNLSYLKRGHVFFRQFQVAGEELQELRSTARPTDPSRYLLKVTPQFGLSELMEFIFSPEKFAQRMADGDYPALPGAHFGYTNAVTVLQGHWGGQTFSWVPFGFLSASARWFVETAGQPDVSGGTFYFGAEARNGDKKVRRQFKIDGSLAPDDKQALPPRLAIKRLSTGYSSRKNPALQAIMDLITPVLRDGATLDEQRRAKAVELQRRIQNNDLPTVGGEVIGVTGKRGGLRLFPYPNYEWLWAILSDLPKNYFVPSADDEFPRRGWRVRLQSIRAHNGLVELELTITRKTGKKKKTVLYQLTGEQGIALKTYRQRDAARLVLKLDPKPGLDGLISVLYMGASFADKVRADGLTLVGRLFGFLENDGSLVLGHRNGRAIRWWPFGKELKKTDRLVRCVDFFIESGIVFFRLSAAGKKPLERDFAIDGRAVPISPRKLGPDGPSLLKITPVGKAGRQAFIDAKAAGRTASDTGSVPLSMIPTRTATTQAPSTPTPARPIPVLTDELIDSSPADLTDVLREIKVFVGFGIAPNAEDLSRAGTYFAPKYQKALDWIDRQPAPGAIGSWNDVGITHLLLIGLLETVAINAVLLPVAPLAYRILYRLHLRYGVAQPFRTSDRRRPGPRAPRDPQGIAQLSIGAVYRHRDRHGSSRRRDCGGCDHRGHRAWGRQHGRGFRCGGRTERNPRPCRHGWCRHAALINENSAGRSLAATTPRVGIARHQTKRRDQHQADRGGPRDRCGAAR